MTLSIITINFNNVAGLKRTVDSVLHQTADDFEYIIIDGASTDGSREFIESCSSKLAYWVSEKDNGVYHAMNKGIGHARGDYLLFLNSGDYLNDAEVLARVFNRPLQEDIIYGDIIWGHRRGKIYRHIAGCIVI